MEREAEKRLHHGGGGVTGRGGAWGETPGEGGGVRMAAAPLPLQPRPGKSNIYRPCSEWVLCRL